MGQISYSEREADPQIGGSSADFKIYKIYFLTIQYFSILG